MNKVIKVAVIISALILVLSPFFMSEVQDGYTVITYIVQGVLFCFSGLYYLFIGWEMHRRKGDIVLAVILFILSASYTSFAFIGYLPILDEASTSIDWILVLYILHSVYTINNKIGEHNG